MLVLAILILILLVSAAVTSSMAHQLHPSSLGTSALFLSFGLVGLVVAWHQPGSPMGWVLLGVTFFYSLGGIGTAYYNLALALARDGHRVTVLYALGSFWKEKVYRIR